MPRHSETDTQINTPKQTERKATQRERLLRGMISTANREGYVGASVSQVISEAGVSRPTFYDYFEDRDDCFIAAIADVQERLLGEVHHAIAEGTPGEALASGLRATFDFVEANPADARFLMKEALAGGPRALDTRDSGLRDTAKRIEAALGRAAAESMIPDLPVVAVLGATHRLLAARLRRGERGGLSALLEDLLTWTESYARRGDEQGWRKLQPHRVPERSPHISPVALEAPPRLGPGRPRLREAEVAENHRQRIMFAMAQAVRKRGYSAATVSEITRQAGVDGGAFYQLFTDKQEAFSAIHELGLQYLMAATAAAFFAASTWAERIWEAFRAASQRIDDMPTFAHVAFVEAYAGGPIAIQRAEDSRMAFAIFLQEGYRDQRAKDAPPSQVAIEAIITTIFEIVYLQIRASAKPRTAALLAPIVYLCLTPFLGRNAAEQTIDAQLSRGGEDSTK